MKGRKFASKFKTKVVPDALKQRSKAKELAQRFEISPQQVKLWEREFLGQAESAFAKGPNSGKSESEQKEDRLLITMGQQKVELDFLRNALR